MSQDSNIENSSNGKKRLSLKRKSASGEASPPSGVTPTPESTTPPQAAPSVGATEPKTMKMSLKPKGESDNVPKASPKASTPPSAPAATASPDSTPKPPTSEPTNNLPASSEPKKVPIKFADGDVIETAAPFKETPPPVKSGPKPPPGVKIVKDDSVPAKKKAETRPPMLPPVINTPTAQNLPAMPQPAPDLVEDTEDKSPKMGKSIAAMVLIFIILVAGIGALVIGGMKLMKDDTDSTEVPATNTPPSGELTVPTQGTYAVDNTINTIEIEPIERIPTEAVAPEPTVSPTPIAPSEPANTATKVQSAEVTSWIELMRPNAIMGNRMTINDKSYRLGDTVDEDLAIEWVAHDPDLLVLTFRDANGVLYEKDY